MKKTVWVEFPYGTRVGFVDVDELVSPGAFDIGGSTYNFVIGGTMNPAPGDIFTAGLTSYEFVVPGSSASDGCIAVEIGDSAQATAANLAKAAGGEVM